MNVSDKLAKESLKSLQKDWQWNGRIRSAYINWDLYDLKI